MNDKKIQRSGIFAAIMSNSIFGFSFMFSKIALRSISTEAMLMLRFDMAFLIMLVLALTVSKKENAPRWLRVNLKGKSLLPLILLGVLQPIVYFLCEANGVRLTNSSTSGVIIATIPVFAMALGVVFLKERVSPLQVVFALVSVTGIALLTLGQKESGGVNPIGIACLFGAVLAAAVFNNLSRRFSVSYTAMESTLVMMGMGAAFFTITALIKGTDISGAFKPDVLVSLLYLGILSSTGAFMFLNYANSILPVAKATAFSNVTTVLSLFAGVVFLHEPIAASGIIASVLIIIGIIGVQKSGYKTQR